MFQECLECLSWIYLCKYTVILSSINLKTLYIIMYTFYIVGNLIKYIDLVTYFN